MYGHSLVSVSHTCEIFLGACTSTEYEINEYGLLLERLIGGKPEVLIEDPVPEPFLMLHYR
jgi:hypothetical protein